MDNIIHFPYLFMTDKISSERLIYRNKAQTYLMKRWEIVATEAWRGFKDLGRGYLLFDEMPPDRIRYVPVEEGAEADKNNPSYIIAPIVQGYNPHKEVVVAVKWHKKRTTEFFILKGQLDPPQAYNIFGKYLYDPELNKELRK